MKNTVQFAFLLCAFGFPIAVIGGDNWSKYIPEFNAADEELYSCDISNAEAETFLRENAPAFECSDAEIERVYHFRWWTFRKHLHKTPDGWIVTEFLPNVKWAGKYNAIVCAAGHHFMEGRWLRDRSYLADYARFWFDVETEDKSHLYSSWLATGIDAAAKVSGDWSVAQALLDRFVRHYRRWETSPFIRLGFPMGGDGKGLFTSTDNNEGTEMSLSGHGYRPLFNSAQWSEAKTIARLARKARQRKLADEFEMKARRIEDGMFRRLWNDRRKFFTAEVKGRISDVRELHGYALWYFGMKLDKYDEAWSPLLSKDGFAGAYGLSFPERSASGFRLSYTGHECQWNGPSWPFATSIALSALRNRLQQDRKLASVSAEDFAKLLHQYAAAHYLKRGDGTRISWIDENLNPDTGDWMSRTIILNSPDLIKAYPRERGKDYNHSTFCDLVITGYVGLIPSDDNKVEVKPLGTSADYFRLSNVLYHGRTIAIQWDRTGGRYGVKGLKVIK